MISIKVTGVKHQLLRLDPHKVRKAGARALNRVARKGLTASRREITRQYTIKQKDIKRNIKLKKKASPSSLHAVLEASGERTRLIKFQHRKTKAGVKVRVKKGGSLKLLSSAFTGEMKTTRGRFSRGRAAPGVSPSSLAGIGKTAIFARVGAKRLPIRQLFGPSVPQMFSSREVHTALEERVSLEFPKEFDHELEWQMRKGR